MNCSRGYRSLAHDDLLGFGAARPDLGPVPDDLDRDVADDEARLADQPERLAQQGRAGRARPLRAGRAEVLAEIAEPGRGQQGVADGMRRHVTIRMTGQARLTRPEQASQIQLS